MREDTNQLNKEMISWRRDLHRHPELGFEEMRTAAFVRERLASFGLEVETGIGGTGIVGVLKRGTSAASIGLRADMDALPIQEENTFEHRSKRDGVFHGCGHDGHTAMLLGAAKHLSQTGGFEGEVTFIFQPAEEHGCGAQAMIDDGLLDRFQIDSVYGMHNWPSLPIGQFAIRPGAMMAAEDLFTITIDGRGGHASLPHLAADPLIAGAQTLLGLQTIVSRTIPPSDLAVVSATEFKTDGARNVIPSTVHISGDVRSFSETNQALIEKRMRSIVDGAAAAAGVRAKTDYAHAFAVLVNDEDATQNAARAAGQVVGEANVDAACAAIPSSEDFAWMLKQKPGAYILLGTGRGAETKGLHHPHYDFCDAALMNGVQYWTSLVRMLLPE